MHDRLSSANAIMFRCNSLDFIEPDALLYMTEQHADQGFAWAPHYILFDALAQTSIINGS
jgi:hypothetical protein